MQSSIEFNIRFTHPWVILVRICASTIGSPSKVKNVRFRSIDKDKILILWNDFDYSNHERCIRTYEIYYAPIVTSKNVDDPQILQWELITANKHIPFLSYYHQVKTPKKRLEGLKISYILYIFII